jgi:chromatin segregation and condensation protein Rec8/ScpA/Scc1 (kleisin family)
MTQEDWELVQHSYGLATASGPSISKKNRRVLEAPTDQFLRKQAYLRFRKVRRPARTAVKVSPTDSTREPLEQLEARLFDRDRFLREFLADPEQSEAKKDAAQKRWLDDPSNRDRQPPWLSQPERST